MTFTYNIVANYLGRLFTIAATYIVIPYYIAYVGESGFGVISFYTILLTFGSLIDAGFSPTFAREVARAPTGEHLPRLLASMETILLVGLILAGGIVIFFAGPIASSWLGASPAVDASEIEQSVVLMGLCLVPQLMTPLYSAVLLGLQRQVAANGLLVLATTLRSFGVIPLLATSPSLETFFLWQIAANLFIFITTRSVALGCLGKNPLFLAKLDLRLLLPMWGFSAGMFAIQAVASINTQLDKLVVSKLFQVEDLGFYTIASTLGLVPYAMTLPILVASLPRMTALFESGNLPGLRQHYLFLAVAIGLIAALASSGILFFLNDIFALWLPGVDLPAYMNSIARLLVCGGFFLGVGSVAFYLGLACGHNRTSVIVGTFTLLFSPLLMVIGAKVIGIIAIAVPWLVFNAINFFVLNVWVVGPRAGYRTARTGIAITGITIAIGLSVMIFSAEIAAQGGLESLGSLLLGGGIAALVVFAFWVRMAAIQKFLALRCGTAVSAQHVNPAKRPLHSGRSNTSSRRR